jgi:hypothetical protein
MGNSAREMSERSTSTMDSLRIPEATSAGCRTQPMDVVNAPTPQVILPPVFTSATSGERALTPTSRRGSLLGEEVDLFATDTNPFEMPTGSDPNNPSPTGSLSPRPLSLRSSSGDSQIIDVSDLPPPPAVLYPDVAKLQPQYEGEERGGTPVEYLDETQRQAYKLTVKGDGKLYDADDQPFDTTLAVSALGSVCSKAIFVMDPDGDFYASNYQARGKFHHSSFLAGSPVASAGDLDVRAGDLREMTPWSGHYKPTSAQQAQGVKRHSA